MKKAPSFHLQFPRLVSLEKRLTGPAELSVDQIKILEKKLITSIQEISSSLEKDDPNPPQINEFSNVPPINIANENVKNDENPEKAVEKPEITVEKAEIMVENAEKTEHVIEKSNEINEKSSFQEKNDQNPRMMVENQKEKKNQSMPNTAENMKRMAKQSIPKRKIEDGSKQACLDEYFLEKPINENSTGIGLSNLKPKVPKTPKDFSKSPISSPMPFQSVMNPEYEKEIKVLREKLTEKDRETKEKERALVRLNEEKARYKEIHENFIEDFLSYKNQVQKLLSNYLLECERYKKNEIKTHLSSQRHRLGEYISQRNGSKFEDIWVDGYELRNLKEMISKIAADKEQLKNRKKGMKKGGNVDEASLMLEKETISHQIKLLTNVKINESHILIDFFNKMLGRGSPEGKAGEAKRGDF